MRFLRKEEMKGSSLPKKKQFSKFTRNCQRRINKNNKIPKIILRKKQVSE